MKPLIAYPPIRARRTKWRCLSLFVTLCLVTVAARATTVIAPAFDELVSQADYTVHAVVKSVSCEWRTNGANLRIITKVELDVKEVISGNPPAPLILEMLGGRIGDRQMLVHGAPEFKVGDEDVLFVHGNGVQANPLVALAHGRYPIKRDKLTGHAYMTRSNGDLLYNEQEVSRSLQPSGVRQEQIDRPQPLTLEAFTDKIRASRTSRSSDHEH